MNPSVMCNSAATNRSSIYTGVPRPVAPSHRCSASARASWLTTRYLAAISAPTMVFTSSSVAPRCSPVATRIVTPSTGIPAWCSLPSSGGSVTRLGAGRVMSHTLIAAVFFPAASATSGSHPIG